MIDLNFLDEIDEPEVEETVITDNPPEVGSEEQQSEELMQLKELAENVGSYKWIYDGDNKEHDGIITQELLKVPGLASAVKIDPETGLQTVDTNFLSLATLGYISALARLVLGEK